MGLYKMVSLGPNVVALDRPSHAIKMLLGGPYNTAPSLTKVLRNLIGSCSPRRCRSMRLPMELTVKVQPQLPITATSHWKFPQASQTRKPPPKNLTHAASDCCSFTCVSILI